VSAKVGLTLYVWRQKQVLPTDMGTSLRHGLERGYGAGAGAPEYDVRMVLPEDQQTALELVQRLAGVRGMPVELVDLGRARHVLDRRMARERGWRDFPVLASPDGRTLVGSSSFTESAVTEFLRAPSPPKL
jgi:hypothetical protein